MNIFIIQPSPTTSSTLGTNILLSTLFSNTKTKFHTHTKQQGKL